MSDKIYIIPRDVGNKGTGKSLYFMWQGTALGIKQEGDADYTFVELKGKDGTNGKKGDNGVTPNIKIGNVTTLSPTLSAYATIEGTAENPIISFGIPKGESGKDGKTPTKGVDYYTTQEINALKIDIQNNLKSFISTEIDEKLPDATKLKIKDAANIFDATNTEDALIEIYNSINKIMEEEY